MRNLSSTLMVALKPNARLNSELLFHPARIIVGTGATIERGPIVVRNGRIVSVAAGAATAQGAQTIDARGMAALPRFIDAHRHIMGGNDERWFTEQSVARMQEFLDAGYTTLMSGGGPVPGILEHAGDVRVIERGEKLRFPLEARQPIGILRDPSGSTLRATSRFRCVSRARYTSPIPPAPRADITSYGPTRTPGWSGNGWRDYNYTDCGGSTLVPATPLTARQQASATQVQTYH